MKFPDLTPGMVGSYYAHRVPELPQKGSEWRWKCPVHQGNRFSFSVNAETGRAKCHSECGTGWDVFSLEQVLTGCDPPTALRQVAEITGLVVPYDVAAPPGQAEPEPKRQGKIDQVYSYEDATGLLIYQQVRYSEPKDFRVRRPDPKKPDEWIWKLGEQPRLLYRLPEVLEASAVVLCEGEKDADAVTALGLCGTTTGAASTWLPSHAEHLEGKSVLIVPDADEDGWKYGAAAASSLLGVAGRITVLHLPGLKNKRSPKGKVVNGDDVSDWLERGGTRDELIRLASHHGRVIDNMTDAHDVARGPVDMSWLERVPHVSTLRWVKRPWLVENLIPMGAFSIIAGRSGGYKSTFVFDMCRCINEGTAFGNHFGCRHVPILTLDLENSEGDVADIRRRLNADDLSPERPWSYWGDWVGQPEPPPGPDDPRVIEWARVHKGLIVFDTFIRFHHGSEIDNDELKVTTKNFKRLRQLGATVLVIHHAGKGESKYRGGSEIEAGADCLIHLEREDTDLVKFEHVKCRHGKEQRDVDFRLTAEGFDHGSSLFD